jgi:DNA-binding response OmpR family regulator
MPSTPPRDQPSGALRGKVLCIEDVDANYQLIESLLAQHHDVQLLRAATGHDGVERVRSERPDFVLLDMNLPDISGLEVVRQLSDTIAEHDLRVTILTGDRQTMDIIKAMSLGAYEYMVKPLDARALEAGMRRALTGERADPSGRLSTHH